MTFDPPPEPCPCGSPNCPCGKCHGVGWAWVSAGYPLAQVPEPPFDLLASLDPAATELLRSQLAAARAAAAASVYPCRACNSSLFFRWREGHLSDDHDRADCADCQSVGVAPRRRRVHA